ncbi:hypothetical protein HL667_06900 [Bradyrhizobium sp. 83012]|uniref:Uncharacterized protein n=1 Tax=Bradyrhizobium aeschynomenes TaxID=2734909 RepID=A0ABX2CBG8_9BRAD|nr:hypothetical protein [Bradyrhizobium aeschynomenes]NPU64717.1 hypothetical protein [Bradyrhizobium aeschynomenes]
MKRTTDLGELAAVVEQLRSELHPEINSDFLAAVIQAEEQNPDDDEGALRAIQAALRVALEARG